MDRRTLLKWLVNGAGAAVGALVGGAAFVNGLAPLFRERREARWLVVGPLDEFEAGKVTRALVSANDSPGNGEGRSRVWSERTLPRAVYVWRRGDGEEVVVYSISCTDLSCPVTFDAGAAMFYCPCHGGIFNEEGEPVAGPPNRPLYRYATRVREGVLEIDVRSIPPMA